MITITYHGRKIRLNDTMQAALEWAVKHSGRWQDIGKEPEWIDAVKRLEAEGLVDIFEARNQYRVDDKALGEGDAKQASGGKVARGSRQRAQGKGK